MEKKKITIEVEPSYSRSYRRFIAWDISQYHRTTGKASRNKRQPLKIQ